MNGLPAPYVQVAEEVRALLVTEDTKRTGSPVSTTLGDFTIFTQRVYDYNQIVQSLPCITIDIDDAQIGYDGDDVGLWRLIPLVLVVYIPLDTRGKSEAEAWTTEAEVDLEIRRVYGDLEEVLSSPRARTSVYSLFLVEGGGMPAEPLEGSDEVPVRMRAGYMNLVARNAVR